MVFRSKGVPTTRGCAILMTRDGVNLTILRPAASWSSTFQERIDAGKKVAAFLNVPISDESAEPG